MQPSLDIERPVATARAIFNRLFVPVDYSCDSHRAVGAAVALGRALGSAVCLFHAEESSASDEWLAGIGSPAVGADWVAEAEHRLARFVDNVVPDVASWIEFRACVGGDMVRLIHDEARRWGATLLVVAADVHARYLRSTAERLIHDFELPTLVIPALAPRRRA